MRLRLRAKQPASVRRPVRFAIEQARIFCAAEGLNCEHLTREIAVELLSGNAWEIDWTSPSDLTNRSPIDITLCVFAIVGTDGEAARAETLSRLGASCESASKLARKAAEVESAIGTDGVSVTAGEPGGPASPALRTAVEKLFRVVNTPSRADPLHRTIELPKPVTREVADLFNQLFRRAR